MRFVNRPTGSRHTRFNTRGETTTDSRTVRKVSPNRKTYNTGAAGTAHTTAGQNPSSAETPKPSSVLRTKNPSPNSANA
jgi:hypothetical protein